MKLGALSCSLVPGLEEAGRAMWLKIQPEGADALTFEWGSTRPYPCVYRVGRESIQRHSRRIRGILEKLSPWSQFKNPQQLCTLLKELAEEGAALRFT